MVHALMLPSRNDDSYNKVTKPPVTVPHIAIGLCVATAIVLLWPHPKREHQVEEEHLLKSYGIAMSTFGLL